MERTRLLVPGLPALLHHLIRSFNGAAKEQFRVLLPEKESHNVYGDTTKSRSGSRTTTLGKGPMGAEVTSRLGIDGLCRWAF